MATCARHPGALPNPCSPQGLLPTVASDGIGAAPPGLTRHPIKGTSQSNLSAGEASRVCLPPPKPLHSSRVSHSAEGAFDDSLQSQHVPVPRCGSGKPSQERSIPFQVARQVRNRGRWDSGESAIAAAGRRSTVTVKPISIWSVFHGTGDGYRSQVAWGVSLLGG